MVTTDGRVFLWASPPEPPDDRPTPSQQQAYDEIVIAELKKANEGLSEQLGRQDEEIGRLTQALLEVDQIAKHRRELVCKIDRKLDAKTARVAELESLAAGRMNAWLACSRRVAKLREEVCGLREEMASRSRKIAELEQQMAYRSDMIAQLEAVIAKERVDCGVGCYQGDDQGQDA